MKSKFLLVLWLFLALIAFKSFAGAYGADMYYQPGSAASEPVAEPEAEQRATENADRDYESGGRQPVVNVQVQNQPATGQPAGSQYDEVIAGILAEKLESDRQKNNFWEDLWDIFRISVIFLIGLGIVLAFMYLIHLFMAWQHKAFSLDDYKDLLADPKPTIPKMIKLVGISLKVSMFIFTCGVLLFAFAYAVVGLMPAF